jgi:hypothetical protein
MAGCWKPLVLWLLASLADAQTCAPSTCGAHGACNGGLTACVCAAGWAGATCDVDLASLLASPPPPSPPTYPPSCGAAARDEWAAEGYAGTPKLELVPARTLECASAIAAAQGCVARGATCAARDARASDSPPSGCGGGATLCTDGSCAAAGTLCAELASCPPHAPKRCLDGGCVPLSAPCAPADARALCGDGRGALGGTLRGRYGGRAGSAAYDDLLDAAGPRLCPDGLCVRATLSCARHDGCAPAADDDGDGAGHGVGVGEGEAGVVRCDDGSCVPASRLALLGPAALARCSAAHGAHNANGREALALDASRAPAGTTVAAARAAALRPHGATIRAWLHAPLALAGTDLGALLLNLGSLGSLADGLAAAADALAPPAWLAVEVEAPVRGRGQRARVGTLRLVGASTAAGIAALFAPPSPSAELGASALGFSRAPAPSSLRAATRPARWRGLRGGVEASAQSGLFGWEDLLLSPAVSLVAPRLSALASERLREDGRALGVLGGADGGRSERSDADVAAALAPGVYLELVASTRTGVPAGPRPAGASAGGLAADGGSGFALDGASGAAVGVCLGALEGLAGTLGAWRCVAAAAVLSTTDATAAYARDADPPFASAAVDGAPLALAVLRARVPFTGALAYAFIAHDGSEPYVSFRVAPPLAEAPRVPFALGANWRVTVTVVAAFLAGVALALACCCSVEAQLQLRRRVAFVEALRGYARPMSAEESQAFADRFGLGIAHTNDRGPAGDYGALRALDAEERAARGAAGFEPEPAGYAWLGTRAAPPLVRPAAPQVAPASGPPSEQAARTRTSWSRSRRTATGFGDTADPLDSRSRSAAGGRYPRVGPF